MKQALRTFLKEKQNQQSVYRSSDDMVHTITESMGGEQIVGGEEADYGQIYSIVSLRSKRCGKKCPIHNGKRIPFHACGGVLLTRSVVLTAAHCCIDEKTAKRDRNEGSLQRSTKPGQVESWSMTYFKRERSRGWWSIQRQTVPSSMIYAWSKLASSILTKGKRQN